MHNAMQTVCKVNSETVVPTFVDRADIHHCKIRSWIQSNALEANIYVLSKTRTLTPLVAFRKTQKYRSSSVTLSIAFQEGILFHRWISQPGPERDYLICPHPCSGNGMIMPSGRSLRLLDYSNLQRKRKLQPGIANCFQFSAVLWWLIRNNWHDQWFPTNFEWFCSLRY